MTETIGVMPKSPITPVRIPLGLKARVAAKASAEGTTLSGVVIDALDEYAGRVTSDRAALLLRAKDGSLYAVICKSRADADDLRTVTPCEVVGVAPIITAADAMLADKN